MATLQELLNAQSAVADRNRAKDWSARNRAAFGGILDVNQYLPVTGDIQSGILAAQDLNEGAYGSAALNALGLLPFVPAMGGVVKKAGKAAKTKYEIAQDVAQKNAALPISEGGLGLPANNTAMDRAKAMGFDTENMWFRGDKPNLSEFNPNETSNYIKGNIFLTDKKPIASWYARTGKPKDIMNMPSDESEGVYSLFTKNNPRELKIEANESSWADVPVPKAWKKSFYGGTGQIDDLALMANQKKYPSMQVNNVFDQYGLGNQKVIFKPSDIRSVSAAFDPMRRNEADILAGVGGASLAGLLGLSLLDQQQYD